MDRLEWLVSLGAALVGVSTAVMLLMPTDRRAVQTRFAALLLVLALTLVVRAVDREWPHLGWRWLAFTSFAVFPLLTGLFMESALPAGLPLIIKIMMLSGLAIPIVGVVPAVLQADAFLAFVGVWQVSVYAALLAFLVWRVAVATDDARRSVAIALLLGALLSMVALGNDWGAALGWPTRRLGAALLIVVFHVVAEALFAEERFHLRQTLLRLGLIGLGALSMSLLINWYQQLPADTVPPMTLMLFFAMVAVLPIRSALQQLRSRQLRALELRLTTLPTTSINAFLEALRGWPELRVVVVLPPEQQAEAGLHELPRLLRENQGVLDRAALTFLRSAAPASSTRAIEQALHLLALHELDAVVGMSEDGAVLGVGFTALVPSDAHRHALAVVAALARLLYQGPTVST
jgi:hypothetical protein